MKLIHKQLSRLYTKWCNKQLYKYNKKIKVLIVNTIGLNAYCNIVLNRIVMSIGMIAKLKENEVKAILAHEMAHLFHLDNNKHINELFADRFSIYLGGNELDLIKALYKLDVRNKYIKIDSLSHPSIYKRAHNLNVFCFDKEDSNILIIKDYR